MPQCFAETWTPLRPKAAAADATLGLRARCLPCPSFAFRVGSSSESSPAAFADCCGVRRCLGRLLRSGAVCLHLLHMLRTERQELPGSVTKAPLQVLSRSLRKLEGPTPLRVTPHNAGSHGPSAEPAFTAVSRPQTAGWCRNIERPTTRLSRAVFDFKSIVQEGPMLQ